MSSQQLSAISGNFPDLDYNSRNKAMKQEGTNMYFLTLMCAGAVGGIKVPSYGIESSTTKKILLTQDIVVPSGSSGTSPEFLVYFFPHNLKNQGKIFIRWPGQSVNNFAFFDDLEFSENINDSYSKARFVSALLTVMNSTIATGLSPLQGNVDAITYQSFFDPQDLNPSILPYCMDEKSSVANNALADGVVCLGFPLYEPELKSTNLSVIEEGFTRSETVTASGLTNTPPVAQTVNLATPIYGSVKIHVYAVYNVTTANAQSTYFAFELITLVFNKSTNVAAFVPVATFTTSSVYVGNTGQQLLSFDTEILRDGTGGPITAITIYPYGGNSEAAWSMTVTITATEDINPGYLEPGSAVHIRNPVPGSIVNMSGAINYECIPNSILAKDLKTTTGNSILSMHDLKIVKRALARDKGDYRIRTVYERKVYMELLQNGFFQTMAHRGSLHQYANDAGGWGLLGDLVSAGMSFTPLAPFAPVARGLGQYMDHRSNNSAGRGQIRHRGNLCAGTDSDTKQHTWITWDPSDDQDLSVFKLLQAVRTLGFDRAVQEESKGDYRSFSNNCFNQQAFDIKRVWDAAAKNRTAIAVYRGTTIWGSPLAAACARLVHNIGHSSDCVIENDRLIPVKPLAWPVTASLCVATGIPFWKKARPLFEDDEGCVIIPMESNALTPMISRPLVVYAVTKMGLEKHIASTNTTIALPGDSLYWVVDKGSWLDFFAAGGPEDHPVTETAAAVEIEDLIGNLVEELDLDEGEVPQAMNIPGRLPRLSSNLCFGFNNCAGSAVYQVDGGGNFSVQFGDPNGAFESAIPEATWYKYIAQSGDSQLGAKIYNYLRGLAGERPNYMSRQICGVVNANGMGVIAQLVVSEYPLQGHQYVKVETRDSDMSDDEQPYVTYIRASNVAALLNPERFSEAEKRSQNEWLYSIHCACVVSQLDDYYVTVMQADQGSDQQFYGGPSMGLAFLLAMLNAPYGAIVTGAIDINGAVKPIKEVHTKFQAFVNQYPIIYPKGSDQEQQLQGLVPNTFLKGQYMQSQPHSYNQQGLGAVNGKPVYEVTNYSNAIFAAQAAATFANEFMPYEKELATIKRRNEQFAKQMVVVKPQDKSKQLQPAKKKTNLTIFDGQPIVVAGKTRTIAEIYDEFPTTLTEVYNKSYMTRAELTAGVAGLQSALARYVKNTSNQPKKKGVSVPMIRKAGKNYLHLLETDFAKQKLEDYGLQHNVNLAREMENYEQPELGKPADERYKVLYQNISKMFNDFVRNIRSASDSDRAKLKRWNDEAQAGTAFNALPSAYANKTTRREGRPELVATTPQATASRQNVQQTQKPPLVSTRTSTQTFTPPPYRPQQPTQEENPPEAYETEYEDVSEEDYPDY